MLPCKDDFPDAVELQAGELLELADGCDCGPDGCHACTPVRLLAEVLRCHANGLRELAWRDAEDEPLTSDASTPTYVPGERE